jgi:oligosaccharide repeat unit polymerase
MSPLMLTAIYDLIFYLPSSLSGIYPDLYGFFSVYIALQSLFFILLSFLLARTILRYKSNVENECLIVKKGFSPLFCFILLSTCVILFLYLFYNVFGDFNFVNIIINNSRFYAKSKIGTAWVFFLYQFILFLMIYDLYKSSFKRYKVVIIVLALLLLGMTGGRSTLISFFVFIFFIYSVVYRKKIRKHYVAIALFVFSLIFFGNAVLRGGEGNTLSKYINSDAFLLDFNNSFILQDSLDYIEENNDFYLIAVQDIIYAFLPRSFFPDKPVSTAETRLVYKDYISDGRTTNITFGIYGNMVINFGIIGMFISPMLVVGSNILYLNMCNRVYKRRPSDFLFLYFFVMYILVLRGGFFNSRIFLAFIVVFFAVVVYEFFSRAKLR